MPQLGKYAVEVLVAYGVSLGLIGALVALSVVQGRRMKRALDEAEGRHRDG